MRDFTRGGVLLRQEHAQQMKSRHRPMCEAHRRMPCDLECARTNPPISRAKPASFWKETGRLGGLARAANKRAGA